MEEISRYHVPTEVIFGVGSLKLLGSEARKLGIRKALWVTDPGPKLAGVLEPGLSSMKAAGVDVLVFDGVPPDPTTLVVAQAAKVARENGCDGLIASGGGSGMGAGKATAILAANSGDDIREYVGKSVLPRPGLTCITIPTTAGSGCEVSRFATAVSDERTQTKLGILYMSAKVAILDPLILKSVPRSQAVASGADAWCHAIEALCSKRATPVTDAIAIRAIDIINKSFLPSVLADDMDAKAEMLRASSMANMACGNAGLGLSHAINAPLTTYFLTHNYSHVAYGNLHAICLPLVMEYNLPACEGKLALIARAFGISQEARSQTQLAGAAVERVKEVLATAGAPRRIPWENVPEADLNELARGILTRIGSFPNPRVPTEAEIVWGCSIRRCAVGKEKANEKSLGSFQHPFFLMRFTHVSHSRGGICTGSRN